MTSVKKSVRSIWPPPPWEVGLSVQLGNFFSLHFVLEKGWDLFWRGGAGTGLPNLNKPCKNCWTLCEVYMPNLLFVIYLELIKKFSLVGGGWVVVDTTVNIVICFRLRLKTVVWAQTEKLSSQEMELLLPLPVLGSKYFLYKCFYFDPRGSNLSKPQLNLNST